MLQVPYDGVTGFTEARQIAAAIEAREGLRNVRGRLLMLGVLVSSETLGGLAGKFPRRYPKVEEIARLLPPHRRTLNLLHYSTTDPDSLREQIKQLIQLGGPNLDGFQINMAWPEPSLIRTDGKYRVVLQLGRHALSMCNNNPREVAIRLNQYRSIVNDVLIDMSGGRGIPMDVEAVIAYAHAINDRHDWLGIGVAGGLSAATLEQLRPLVTVFPFVNVDAEGCMRTVEDHLHYGKMTDYLSAVDGLFV